jgi:acyl carrier protein
MDEELKGKIRDLIADELGIDDDEKIKPDSKLQEDFGADSLDMTELAILLEEEFELKEIPDEQVERFVTVQDVYDYMERKKGS